MLGIMEGLKDKKKIYNQAKSYWHFLFPRLPSYTAFIQRINKLGNAFVGLTDNLQRMLPPEVFAMEHKRLIDSMPIILAHNNRRFKAKVAADIADKNGYCAANKLHYYGVKLHIIGISQPGTIPVPDKIGITAAGVSDVKAYQAIVLVAKFSS
jgi:hypothetical protein